MSVRWDWICKEYELVKRTIGVDGRRWMTRRVEMDKYPERTDVSKSNKTT